MQKIRRTGYFLILLMAAALTTAFVWRPAPMPRFTGLSSVDIPTQIEGFSSQVTLVDPETKAALASAEIASRRYTNSSGRDIDLVVIGGTDRSALHDPRSCLVGAGWKIDQDRVEQLSADGQASVPARTCIATLTDATNNAKYGYDIVYLYVTHKRVIASATAIRWTLLESALLEQNDAPVYFIRLMTPLVEGQGHAAEHSSLIHFAAEFWKQTSPSILKGESS